MDDTLLSSSVTVADYRQFEAARNKDGIANFIEERFTERYITPLQGKPEQKHGFCTMAICCLMIEALESFWRGWSNSSGNSELAFCSFFDRSSNLSVFQGHARDFYRSVRCGILHQAETTNGWHIRREGDLLDSGTKTINATKFHDRLENDLNHYCETLRRSDWNSVIWENLRKKMAAIIRNCEVKQDD